MRNLKRVLSLTLASVMLLGMMVIGSSAAEAKKIDFTDANEIEYTEAVDVMVALGVLEGNPNGDFNPKGSLTREQAAKIICYMLLGEANAEKLSANKAIFTDVAADRWSAGYISYCVERNILAGNGNGSFNPTGELTGVAFGKMLLVALGYDPTIQQYTGASWAISVAADMVDAGIAPAGVLLNAPLTREQAAQTAFQTLTADVVNYASRGTHVTSSDGTTVVVNASKPEAVTNRTADDYRTKVADRDDKQQFCEKYFSDLKKASDTDDFGRTGGVWKLKNAEIVFSADEADAVYTAEVKSKDIYSDLSLSKAVKATVIVDGGTPTTFDVQKSDNTALSFSGNGVLVEAYVDDEDNVTLIVVKTYVGKISKVTAAKDNDARYVTVNSLNYDTESFAKDDVVIYTKADNEIQTMALADVVEGVTVTRKSGTSNFTADGETYKYNKNYNLAASINVDSILDVYLDAYGYVVRVDVSKESTDYAYVLDTGADSGRFSNDLYAKLLLTDGTVVEAKIDKDSLTGANDAAKKTALDNMKKYIVEYSKDSKDVYKLETKGSVLATSANVNIEKGKSAITLGGSTKYANAKTIFLVETSEDHYSVYTGYANVTDLKATGTGSYAVYCEAGDVATVVFISNVSAKSDDIVYVLASKAGTEVKVSDGDNYWEYKAVVNGEITTIRTDETLKGSYPSGAVLSADILFESIAYANEDEEIIDASACVEYSKIDTDDSYQLTGKVTAEEADGIITIKKGSDTAKSYVVSEDAEYYAVTSGDKIDSGSASDLVLNLENVTIIVKNGEIVAFFYPEASAPVGPVTPTTVTKGTVMKSISASDITGDAFQPGGGKESPADYAVPNLTATTAGSRLVIEGTVGKAFQFDKDSTTNIAGFSTQMKSYFTASGNTQTANGSTKIAIIAIQAEDGQIFLWLVGDKTTNFTIDKTVDGVTYNLSVNVSGLTWAD